MQLTLRHCTAEHPVGILRRALQSSPDDGPQSSNAYRSYAAVPISEPATEERAHEGPGKVVYSDLTATVSTASGRTRTVIIHGSLQCLPVGAVCPPAPAYSLGRSGRNP